MTPRGFPNIAHVRDAMGVLAPAIRHGALPPPPRNPWDIPPMVRGQSPVIRVQHLARRVATVYGLDVGLIVVAFRSNITEAGRVELGGPQQRDFFVEIREDYVHEEVMLSAILGHEVAHIFLHRHRLHPPPGLFSEITTDITAVLYGFGAMIADTFRVSEQGERREHHMGYLTPDEVGFVLFRSGFDFSTCLGDITSKAAGQAVRTGAARALRELTAPPLRQAAWWRRLAYRARRWWLELLHRKEELVPARLYALTGGHVHFRCIVCCQGLRVPTRRELTAVCPRCRTSMPCVT